jgi:divalent metal cation (Fe/Co/Zn/Cd) transporter
MTGRSAALLHRGLRLEWITIAWNAAEVFVTVGIGVAAGSLALVAFGLDSVIEIFASLVVIWQLQGDQADSARVRRALRLVGAAFLVLGAFLIVVASVRVIGGARPDESPIGIVYLAITVAVMLTLARLKDRTGSHLGSETLQAEARVTYLDAGLAFGILVALVANALLGWWWSDSLSAAVVGVLALFEARERLGPSAGD